VFAYDCTDDDGVRHVGHVVNPVLDKPSAAAARALDVSGEGCLSVPGPVRDVARPATARLRGVDARGRPVLLEGGGYFGRCLQHETDHLDGRLYIDQLAKDERRSALAEMERSLPEIMAARTARAAELDALLGQG
jgi:peptide deformylase